LPEKTGLGKNSKIGKTRKRTGSIGDDLSDEGGGSKLGVGKKATGPGGKAGGKSGPVSKNSTTLASKNSSKTV
jgi:hypothetical protein